jgi:hypothetical protein
MLGGQPTTVSWPKSMLSSASVAAGFEPSSASGRSVSIPANALTVATSAGLS